MGKVGHVCTVMMSQLLYSVCLHNTLHRSKLNDRGKDDDKRFSLRAHMGLELLPQNDVEVR